MEIVLILENNDGWIPELIDLATAEFRRRSLKPNDFKKFIHSDYRKKCLELIVASEFKANDYSISSGFFLNDKGKHYLFKDELEEYIT